MLNHIVFELKKEHIAMISQLGTTPEKLSLIGNHKTQKSPFINGDTLDKDLAMIIIGKELSDEEKATKDENGESYYTRDNMQPLYDLYAELPQALNIVLNTKSFEPNTYYTRHYENNWKVYVNKYENNK